MSDDDDPGFYEGMPGDSNDEEYGGVEPIAHTSEPSSPAPVDISSSGTSTPSGMRSPRSVKPRVAARDIATAVSRTVSSSNHPVAAFCHVVPKLLAYLVYIFASIFPIDFIFVFVVLVVVLCIDFWVVKNVTGRLLVGLRWWNEVDENGETRWIFEAAKSDRMGNVVDARTFWFGMYINVAIWFLLLLIAILKINIHWMMAVFIALILNITNIYCYLKCEKDARSQLSSVGTFATRFVAERWAFQTLKS